MMDAEAAAVFSKPLVAPWTGLRLTDAVTALDVPDLVLWALLNQAFESAVRNVPGEAGVLRSLGFADALAAVLVPDDVVASLVG